MASMLGLLVVCVVVVVFVFVAACVAADTSSHRLFPSTWRRERRVVVEGGRERGRERGRGREDADDDGDVISYPLVSPLTPYVDLVGSAGFYPRRRRRLRRRRLRQGRLRRGSTFRTWSDFEKEGDTTKASHHRNLLASTTERIVLPSAVSKNGDSSYPSSLSSSSSSSSYASSSSSANERRDNGSGGDVANRGNRFWPPWPFNYLQWDGMSSSSASSLHEDDDVDGSYLKSTDGRLGRMKASSSSSSSSSRYKTGPQLFWMYFCQRTRSGIRQLQQVTKALSYHLPPAAPPLLLLAIIPAKQSVAPSAAATSTAAAAAAAEAAAVDGAASSLSSSVPLLRTSIFARKVALTSLGVAIVSWAHYEIKRQKRLVPLPLPDRYMDYGRAILPPFLPEELPPPEYDPVLIKLSSVSSSSSSSSSARMSGVGIMSGSEIEDEEEEEEGSGTDGLDKVGNVDGDDDVLGNGTSGALSLAPRLKRHLRYAYDSAPKPQTLKATYREWKTGRRMRQREALRLRRNVIMDELIALQQLKKRAGLVERKKSKKGSRGVVTGRKRESNENNNGFDDNDDDNDGSAPSPLGFALVTGASRGIGRAIAVELARWEIPLILVARDIDKLTSLATDLTTCYGIKVCVLQADLSKPNAASMIHRATTNAGLRVDVLVNNAGVCAHGELVESDPCDIERMVQVNTGSVAALSRLYGKDMKDGGRGRMLFVSSVVGAVPAGPGVAVYAATKAFEKALALSMSRELEKHGVGITCLMPGAVKGTAFAKSSSIEDAACWKLPFYPRSAPEVATRGIRAMLAGDSEVYPGWQNRIFLKLLGPMMPQRITTLIVEFAWNPLQFGMPQRRPEQRTAADPLRRKGGGGGRGASPDEDAVRRDEKRTAAPPPQWGATERLPPHILTLPDAKAAELPPLPARGPENDGATGGDADADADATAAGKKDVASDGASGLDDISQSQTERAAELGVPTSSASMI